MKETYRDLIRSFGWSVGEYSLFGKKLSEWASKIEQDPTAYDDYVTIPLLSFADKVGPVINLVTEENVDDFRVVYLPGMTDNSDSVGILCMRPSILFKAMTDQARTVLIASGTLSPFNSLVAELETPFEIQRVAPHVVDKSQVLTLTINRFQDLFLSSTWKVMQERGPEVLEAVGSVIERLVSVVPGAILLFLPSYRVKAQLLNLMEEIGMENYLVEQLGD